MSKNGVTLKCQVRGHSTSLKMAPFEFKWLTMCDMIDIKKRKFLEKFSIPVSENSLCQVIVHNV